MGVSGFGIGFGVVIVLFVLLFVAAVVFIVVTVVRNANRARALGHDPLTMQTELAARVIDSPLLAAAPKPTLEQRLAELDDLRSRGVLTEDEYRAARQKAIDEL